MWSRSALVAAALALAVPAAAAAIEYPPAEDPGKLPPPHPDGGEATLRVCKKPRCFQSIQQAVDASRSGDTIRVANGRYRESVEITNDGRRGLRIVGNPRRPGKVVLNGRRLSGTRAQNAFFVNGVDHVTIKGFTAKRYRANGFLVTNAVGYTLTRLVARRTGGHGIYAFNSRGGTMSRSQAFRTGGAGFQIGQTRPQVKPRRTFVRRVRAHSNVAGFGGSNARYVTLQNSEFRGNQVGITLQALDSERFAPPEFNVIMGNDVFANDRFGMLLLGGRDNVVERNAIHGNRVAGLVMIDQLALADDDVRTLDRNVVRDNAFGLGGAGLNGHDIAYDGSGTGNCFEGNGATQNNVPADGSELVACPFDGANGVNADARRQILGFGG